MGDLEKPSGGKSWRERQFEKKANSPDFVPRSTLLAKDRYGITIQSMNSESRRIQIKTPVAIKWKIVPVPYYDEERGVVEESLNLVFTDPRTNEHGVLDISPYGQYMESMESENELFEKYELLFPHNGIEIKRKRKPRKKNMGTGNRQVDPFAGDFFGKDQEEKRKRNPFEGNYFGKDKEKKPIKGDPFADEQFPK